MNQLELFKPEPRPRIERDLSNVRPSDYPPSHPWHYLAGGVPVPADQIPANDWPAEWLERGDNMASAEIDLADSVARYELVKAQGAGCLSRYDLEIAHGGDRLMAVASALAMTYNQIASACGKIVVLQTQPKRKTK